MKRIVRAAQIAVLVIGTWLVGRTAHAEACTLAQDAPLAVSPELQTIEITELDREVTQRFDELGNPPHGLLYCPELRDPLALEPVLRDQGTRRALVFDRARGRVDLWLAETHAWITRLLTGPDVTAFQMAFAASELLRLGDGLRTPAAPGFGWRNVTAGAGADLDWHGAPYTRALGLALSLNGWLGNAAHPWRLVLGLGATLLERDAHYAARGRLAFARERMTLRVGPGWSSPMFACYAALLLGVAWESVEAQVPFGVSRHTVAGTWGGEWRVDVRLWRGLSLYASAAVSQLAPRHAYTVQGSRVTYDSAWLGSAGGGAAWSFMGP